MGLVPPSRGRDGGWKKASCDCHVRNTFRSPSNLHLYHLLYLRELRCSVQHILAIIWDTSECCLYINATKGSRRPCAGYPL